MHPLRISRYRLFIRNDLRITWQAAKKSGGKARGGRKGCPSIAPVKAGKTYTLLDTDGPGVVRHIWFTFPPDDPAAMRNLIVRMYWDHQETPSVEAPIGDLFGLPHGVNRDMESDYVGFQGMGGFGQSDAISWFAAYRVSSYEEEIAVLKQWMADRLSFLDRNIESFDNGWEPRIQTPRKENVPQFNGTFPSPFPFMPMF